MSKDKIELQDSLDRIQIFLHKYQQDVFSEEEVWENIKEEVEQ